METIESTYNEVLEWDGISAEAFEAVTNLKNQALNAMSELGDWKDCIAYPNYQISSTGAFMNKRTLKMLKHFLHKDSDKPAVTLYRGGKGDVRDGEMLLKIHFGDHAELPKVFYHNDVVTELAPPKAKKKAYKKY